MRKLLPDEAITKTAHEHLMRPCQGVDKICCGLPSQDKVQRNNVVGKGKGKSKLHHFRGVVMGA